MLANFSERVQRVPAAVMSAQPELARDLIGGHPHRLREGLTLAPYQVLWLAYGETA